MFYRIATVNIKEVLDPKNDGDMSRIASILDREANKTAEADKKITANIEPNFLYVVTSGLHGDEPNQNGDYFPWEELLAVKKTGEFAGKYMWESWIGKPILENHNPRNIRGEIIDTFPIKNEKSVDMLLKIDERKNPNMVRGIRNGSINGTSMGVMVGHSYCSVCENLAYNEDEWCDHLHPNKLNLKGKLYQGQDGNKFPEKHGQLVYEINYDLEGVEDSIITLGEPADPKALLRQVLAAKENEMGRELNQKQIDKIAALRNGETGIVEFDPNARGVSRAGSNVVTVGSNAAPGKINKATIDALYAKRGLVRSGSTAPALNVNTDFRTAEEFVTAIKAGNLSKFESASALITLRLVTAAEAEELSPSMAFELLEKQVELEKMHNTLITGQQETSSPTKNSDIPETGKGDQALSANDAKPEENKPAPNGSLDQKPVTEIGDKAISLNEAKPQENKPAPDGSVNPQSMNPNEPSKQADETNKSKPQEDKPKAEKIGQLTTSSPTKNSDIPETGKGDQALSANDAKPEEKKPAPNDKSNPSSQSPVKEKGDQALSANDAKPQEDKPDAKKAQLLPPMVGDDKPPMPPIGGPKPKDGPGEEKVLDKGTAKDLASAFELLKSVCEIMGLDHAIEYLPKKKEKKPAGGGEDKPKEEKSEGPKEEKKPEPKEDKPKEDKPAFASVGYDVTLVEDEKSPADSYYLVALNNQPVLQLVANKVYDDQALAEFKSDAYKEALTKELNAKGCKHVAEVIYHNQGIVVAQALPDDKFNAPAKPMNAEPDALQNLSNDDSKAVDFEPILIGALATVLKANPATTVDEAGTYLQNLASSPDKLAELKGKLSKEIDHGKADELVSNAPPMSGGAAPTPAPSGGMPNSPTAPTSNPLDAGKMAMLVEKMKEVLPVLKATLAKNAELEEKLAKIEQENKIKARVTKTQKIASKKVELGLIDASEVKNESVRLAKLSDEEIASEIEILQNSVKIAEKIAKTEDYTNSKVDNNTRTASKNEERYTNVMPSQMEDTPRSVVTYQWSRGFKS